MSLVKNIQAYSDQHDISADKKEKLDAFLKLGFPTTKDEEWKYTSLKKIVAENYSIDAVGKKIAGKKINDCSIGFENKIIFLDGVLISKPKLNQITISDYSDFSSNESDSVSKLNSAIAKHGYTISIEKNCVVEKTIEILFLNTIEGSFAQYRNIISVGENSEAKFVEKIQNIDCNLSFTNYFTKINCEKNATLEYNKIQDNTPSSRLIDRTDVFQKKDSVCNINTLVFGGEFIRNNLNFEQNGENIESNMHGISVLNNKQVADNHTFVDHKKAHCRSNEIYKGIYLDKSTGIFNGKIMVRKDSQKIEAFQANNNLVLSDNATINTKPQLEIYADDVKCSHGCTIGQLDENALFYMRTRGVDVKEAKAILTYAFAADAINKITVKEVKALAKKLLAKKLNVDLDL